MKLAIDEHIIVKDGDPWEITILRMLQQAAHRGSVSLLAKCEIAFALSYSIAHRHAGDPSVDSIPAPDVGEIRRLEHRLDAPKAVLRLGSPEVEHEGRKRCDDGGGDLAGPRRTLLLGET